MLFGIGQWNFFPLATQLVSTAKAALERQFSASAGSANNAYQLNLMQAEKNLERRKTQELKPRPSPTLRGMLAALGAPAGDGRESQKKPPREKVVPRRPKR